MDRVLRTSRSLGALALLALTACAGLPREKAFIPALEGEWTSRTYHGNPLGEGSLVESIPADETWQGWTRMLTIQCIDGSEESPRELMERILAHHAERCPDVRSAVLAEDDASLTYEWWIDGCPAAPDQHELARILRGNRGLHRVALVARGPNLEAALRSEWLDRLAGAVVMYRGRPIVLEPAPVTP